MENLKIVQPAHARCYKCGSPNIQGICHHCGRGICSDHAKTSLPAQLGIWRAVALNLGLKKLTDPEFSNYEPHFKYLSLREEILSAIRIATIENSEYRGYIFEHPLSQDANFIDQIRFKFRNLKRRLGLIWGNQLGGLIATSIHCEFCAHNVSRYSTLMWIGLLLTPTIIGTPFGLVFLGLGYWLNQKYYIQDQIKQLTPLPLEPEACKIKVKESVAGRINLNAKGEYVTSAEEADGVFRVSMHFGNMVYKRYAAYLQKIQDLGINTIPQQVIDIGYLLVGPANWEFLSGEIWIPDRINIIALNTSIKDGPLTSLLTDMNQSDATLEINHTYRIPKNDYNPESLVATLPLQVVISFRPESNRQAIDIELELIKTDMFSESRTIIEDFILEIPNTLGKIERLLPEGKIEEGTGEHQNYQRITWKKLTFEQKSGKSLRRSIYIQFQNPIDPNTKLKGNVNVKAPVTLSGIDQIRLFTPSGMPSDKQAKVDVESEISVSLDLDLSGLRYQTLKLFEKKNVREGVVPDSKFVSGLVNTISEQDFYVKRVSENPARTSKEGAHKINRYWDIVGRKYEGVYPIDFHLVLTGEEQLLREGGYTAGQLSIETSVQGAVTDTEMEERAQNVSDQLDELIRSTLDQIPLTHTKDMYAKKSPEKEIEPSDKNVKLSQDDHINQKEFETSKTSSQNKDTMDGQIIRIQKLKERIDRLEERLLDGALSEDIYYELKAKYEQELADLGNTSELQEKKKTNKRGKSGS